GTCTKTGPSPASATRARKRSSRAGSSGGSAQVRGFEAHTWNASQPAARALATARSRPPAAETCAPTRTPAVRESGEPMPRSVAPPALHGGKEQHHRGAVAAPAAGLRVLVEHMVADEGPPWLQAEL